MVESSLCVGPNIDAGLGGDPSHMSTYTSLGSARADYLSECSFEQVAVILELLFGLSPPQAINLKLLCSHEGLPVLVRFE